MAKLGFQYIVFARIDYKEKELRKSAKELEFLWYPTFAIDKGQTKILTYISHDHYSVDYSVFNKFFDEYDLYLRDNEEETKKIADKAVDFFYKIRKWYKTDQIFKLLTLAFLKVKSSP